MKNTARNSVHRYGYWAMSFHWLSALGVVGLFALGYWMVDLDYYSEWYKTAPALHKSIGLSLVLVTLFRMIWRKTQVQPKALDTHSKLEKKAGHYTHYLLYILILLVFVSGYMISTADGRGIEVFELFEVPGFGSLFEDQEDIAGEVHEYATYTLVGLALLHAVAALKHHFIDKDETLNRMLGNKR